MECCGADTAVAEVRQAEEELACILAVTTAAKQGTVANIARFQDPLARFPLPAGRLAGTTVDIGKRGMSKQEHAWVERYLADLKEKNLVEPLEERRQACFHVMVFDRYQNWRDDLALSRANKTEATAATGVAQR